MTAQTDDIRILLVDDHMVVRKGLTHVLQSFEGLSVVGEAAHGEEALALCATLRPDIVIMDVKMEQMDGIEATRKIAQAYPMVRIIGLSTFADTTTITDMFRAGAQGYLFKDVTAQELASAIQRIHAGERLKPPEILDTGRQMDPVAAELGDQQRRVLALMSKGFTNAEIAAYLNISQTTARYHVSAILKKLDVSNRAEAAALAIRTKLVDENDL